MGRAFVLTMFPRVIWILVPYSLLNVSETYIGVAGPNFLRTCRNLLEVRLGVRFPTGKQGSYQVSCFLLLMLLILLAQSMMLIPDSNPAASTVAISTIKEFQNDESATVGPLYFLCIWYLWHLVK
jgi:hypothetical protein